jgi:hypothetical protein
MFVYHELDGFTRKYMRQEFLLDRDDGNLYQSKLLSDEGLGVFPDLLLEAINYGTNDTFAQKLNKSSYWGPRAHSDSNKTLAEEQFNQYYMRGLLRKLLEEGFSEAEVYRACEDYAAGRRGAQPGERINCEEALADLRDANRELWRGKTGLVRCAKAGISLKRPGEVRAN